MQHILRIVCVLSIVALAVSAQAAAIDPAKIAAVDKAAEAFLALAKDSYKTGQPPRQTDPAAKPLLDTVFDTAGINGGDAASFEDAAKLNGWMVQTVKVGTVYLLAGTGVQDPTQMGNINQQQQALVAKNVAAFAPEIGRYLDAQMDLEHAIIDAVDAEMKAHPDKYQSAQSKGGLAQIKGGVKQSLTGVLAFFVTPGINAAWMQDRLRTLSSIAPSLARSLADQDRHDLAELARQTAAKIDDPEVKSGLERFANATLGALPAAPQSPSASAPGNGLTGADRDAYVQEYLSGCTASMQKENPGVAEAVAKTFCGCLANKGADITTPADFAEIKVHGTTPEQRQRMVPFAAACRELAVQGAASTGSPSTVGQLLERGGKRLTGAEIKKLFAGATITGTAMGTRDSTFQLHYVADGTTTGEGVSPGGSTKISGTWSVNDKDQYCQNLKTAQGTPIQGCFYYFLDGEKLFAAPTDDKASPVYERQLNR